MNLKRPIAKLAANEVRLGTDRTKLKSNKRLKKCSNWNSKKFFFLSDALSFQRKKRKEGFKTRKSQINNASEFYYVYWTEK